MTRNNLLSSCILEKKISKEEGGKKPYTSKTINKIATKTYISINTLNVHRLNAPTKKHVEARYTVSNLRGNRAKIEVP